MSDQAHHLDHPALAAIVKWLISKHGLTAFIETGTGYSRSLRWADEQGLALYSCDVEFRQVESARDEFPDATIWCAPSDEFLRYACAEVKEPALFWLDAHDSPESTATWPLAEDLAIIRELRDGRDVILMDDIEDPRFDFDGYVGPFKKSHRVNIKHGALWLEPKL